MPRRVPGGVDDAQSLRHLGPFALRDEPGSVPIQAELQKFLATIPKYPFQEGQSLNASGINYRSLKALNVLKQIEGKGLIEVPGR